MRVLSSSTSYTTQMTKEEVKDLHQVLEKLNNRDELPHSLTSVLNELYNITIGTYE